MTSSRRLPVTFGKAFDDSPANTRQQYPSVAGRAECSEGVFVGRASRDVRLTDEFRVTDELVYGEVVDVPTGTIDVGQRLRDETS